MEVLRIVYDKPNLYTLPYHDEQKKVRFFEFKPGINEIGKDVWELIRKENKARLDYVDEVLKPFKPKPSKELPEEQKKTVQSKLDNGQYDVSVMEFSDIKTLVENTFEKEVLKKYASQEKAKPEPRKNVLKAIDDAVAYIETLESSANKKKEE